ncbi:unnamed protein product, partial [Linum tenue]
MRVDRRVSICTPLLKKTPKSEQDGNEVCVIGGKVSSVVEDEWMHDGADSVRNASIASGVL